jgi:hypothetical protein
VSKNQVVMDAERQIEGILAKLESDSGMLVDQIEIQKLDVSTFHERKYIKHVKIQMRDVHSEGWGSITGLEEVA